ncbi:hypothetical protein BVY00_01970, partial [bacterium G20]
AANRELRKQAQKRLSPSVYPELSRGVIYPDIKLCTDNAAMIATLGYFQAKYGQSKADPYSLEAHPGLKM